MDRIQIDRTTEWLPLTLVFRQIGLSEMEGHLARRKEDSEKSDGKRNLTEKKASFLEYGFWPLLIIYFIQQKFFQIPGGNWRGFS